MNLNLPLVVIFGRTNVGKSTLFNRLTEQSKALISDIPGTTRDSNIGEVDWQGAVFKLVDTGGIIDTKNLISGKSKKQPALGGQTDDIDTKVQEQAREYLKRADLILFIVDVKAGLLPTDRDMSVLVKKIIAKRDLDYKNKIILIANKADNPRLRFETNEFNKLGLGEPLAISSTTGSGTGDLLDKIVKVLNIKKNKKTEASGENNIKVCIVGKPNVGKSSLINKLLGEDKFIVSSTPHTTREPQDIEVEYESNRITFIDTAGLSRQGQKNSRQLKLKNTLEKLSITKSLGSLAKADIALLVIDANEPISHQETKILEEIKSRKKGLIIIANKWDIVKNDDLKKFKEFVYSYLPFATWAPIECCSALTGLRVHKIFKLILEVNVARQTTISENALSKFLVKIIKMHRPPRGKFLKAPRLTHFTQTGINPPVFSLKIGAGDNIHESYLRYIENRLREKFGFQGTPITIWVDKNRKVHGKAD